LLQEVLVWEREGDCTSYQFLDVCSEISVAQAGWGNELLYEYVVSLKIVKMSKLDNFVAV